MKKTGMVRLPMLIIATFFLSCGQDESANDFNGQNFELNDEHGSGRGGDSAEAIEIPSFCIDFAGDIPVFDSSFRSVAHFPIPINFFSSNNTAMINGAGKPRQKLSNYVLNRQFGPWDTKANGDVGLSVIFKKEISLTSARELVFKYGATYESQSKVLHTVFVSVSPAELDSFLAIADNEECVIKVAGLPAPLSPTNNRVRRTSGVDKMRMVYPNYDGMGVVAGIYDSRTTCHHVDFDGRLTIGVGEEETTCGEHSTHTAGILGGSGMFSVDWGEARGERIFPFRFMGVAPGVEIVSYALSSCGRLVGGCLYGDAGDIEHDFENLISLYGADVISMSLGTNIAMNYEPCSWEGDTSLAAILLDTISAGLYGKPVVFNVSAGNERSEYFYHRCGAGYGTFGTPAAGIKNGFVIGSVDAFGRPSDFTSFGPTDDGRIGILGCILGEDVWSTVWQDEYEEMSGTSMSSPGMAGLEALMIQAYYEKYEESPKEFLIKAILANNLEEAVGTPYGPDFQCGFGYAAENTALGAVETIRQERFIEDEISQGEELSYLFVASGDPPQVKVTLAWRDDPGSVEKQEAGLSQLVYDLDLTLESGKVHYPLVPDPAYPDNRATEKEDHLNNVEQIIIERPESKCYVLKVKGFNVPVGPHQFAVAYSGLYKWPLKPNVQIQPAHADSLAPRIRIQPPEDCGG